MSGRAVAIASCERGAARAVAVGADREHHQPAGDDGVDRGERQDRKSDARARLRRAIDIAPVEQAADQPLPPGFGGLCGRVVGSA